MYLDIDGKRMDAKSVTGFTQELDMKKARFTTSFIIEIKRGYLYLLFPPSFAFYGIDGCHHHSKKRYYG